MANVYTKKKKLNTQVQVVAVASMAQQMDLREYPTVPGINGKLGTND